MLQQQQSDVSSDPVASSAVAQRHWKIKPKDRRAEASKPLEGLSFEDLLTLHATERSNRERRTRLNQRIMLSLFAALLLVMVALGLHTKKFPWEIMNSFGSFAGLLGITAGATAMQKRAVRSFAKIEDVRAVGPLAEALEFGDRQLRSVAINALIRWLPELQASDGQLLDDAQRASLRRTLSGSYCAFLLRRSERRARGSRRYEMNRGVYRFNPDLAIAVMKALEQIGDERDLAAVQRLADGAGRGGHQARVREAAQQCLPFLRQRADEQRIRQTLLRPSGVADTPADLLVRPAQGVTGDNLHLLRACLQNGQPVTDADTELLLAILSNLEAVGDARALPYVEQIAARETLSPALRDAARRCLLALRAQVEGSVAQVQMQSL